MVLAVGEDEEGAGALRVGPLARHVEGLHGDAERLPEVGPLRRDERGLGGVEEEADGAEVGRQRALEERLAREHDEADAAAGEVVEHLVDLVLRPRQPARRHVLGQHRLRDVEGDDHVEPLLLDLAELRPVARPGEREREAGYAGRGERGLPAPLAGRRVARRIVASGEAAERGAPLHGRPCEQPRRRTATSTAGARHGVGEGRCRVMGQGRQARWGGRPSPAYGTRRSRVVESATPSRSRPNAGQRNRRSARRRRGRSSPRPRSFRARRSRRRSRRGPRGPSRGSSARRSSRRPSSASPRRSAPTAGGAAACSSGPRARTRRGPRRRRRWRRL